MKRIEKIKAWLIPVSLVLIGAVLWRNAHEAGRAERVTRETIAENAASLAENAGSIKDVYDILKQRSPDDVYSLVDARLTVLEAKIEILQASSSDDRWKRAAMIDYMNEVRRLNPGLKLPEIKASGK